MKKIKFPLIGLLLASLLTIAFFACKKDLKDPTITSNAKAPSTLNPLTLTCAAVSGAAINVTVCAGASGASAGFSIQWETLADYNLYGWSSTNAPSYRCASLSGVPGCANNYSLSAGQCATVNIGDNLFDDCGASATCGPTELKCGTEYIFRAFAHNIPGGLKASDKSGTTQCTTFDCGTTGCTYTQGYWKTHGPVGCNPSSGANLWPADIQTNGLTIGGVLYTQDQLCSILNTPAGGTNLAVAHQLIAALMNIANGSDGSTVQSCIDAAQTYLATYGLNGKISSDGSNLVTCLTNFNEGATGPGHCSD